MILRLASRNLLRSPRRTVLTSVAIVAGVAISILGKGWVDGLVEGIIVGATDGTVGHVMARPAGYPTLGGQRPVDELLELTPEAEALLAREAVAWTARTQFAPIVARGSDALRAMAIGFDTERDEAVFPRTHWSIEGALPAAGSSDVAVSTRLARLLGIQPGDRVVLQVRTHRGAMNALEVQVSGLVRTGNPAIDTLGMFVPHTLTAKLLAAEAPSHLSVKLGRRGQAATFAQELQAAMGAKVEVVTWESESKELVESQELRRQSLNLVVFVLLALAALGVANTILMAAHERVREIGTLRAMGMNTGGVVRLFLAEGALLGLVAGLLGAVMGGALVVRWSTHPVDLSAMFENLGGNFSSSTLIYTQFDPTSTVATVVAAVLIAASASLYPARVASRMAPAEAIRST